MKRKIGISLPLMKLFCHAGITKGGICEKIPAILENLNFCEDQTPKTNGKRDLLRIYGVMP